MLTNCCQCQYFNHHPHHSGDILCAIAPAYTEMWKRLKSLDEYTLNSLPVHSCGNFDLNPSLEKKEISLALTFPQWQRLIREYDCSETLLNALQNKLFEHSLSLTLGDWQAIANSSRDQSVLETLKEHGIEPEDTEERWLDVDSSFIGAIAFNRSESCLYIRFCNQSVYLYREFNSQLFQDFVDADSKGQFFHLHIKDLFPYRLYA